MPSRKTIEPATAERLPLELASAAARAEAQAARRRLTLRAAVTGAAVLAVGIAARVGGVVSRAERDIRELERARPSIEAARSVRADLDAATAALAFIERHGESRSHYARLLADLAAALPDSAFVIALQSNGAATTISGYAVRVADVVRALDRSRFSGSTVDGAVTRETVAGRERDRFTIRLAWRP